jgi:hypothetical protein
MPISHYKESKMKKIILSLAVMTLLASTAFAGSIQVQRGAVYLPDKQTKTGIVTAESTCWTDATYLAAYTKRVFALKNKGGDTIQGIVYGSNDASTWFSVDSSSLANVTSGTSKVALLNGYPFPYWKVGVTGGATTTSVEVWSVQSTN